MNLYSCYPIVRASSFDEFGESNLLFGLSIGSPYGLFAGGDFSDKRIDYITIATTGDASDFGDLTFTRQAMSSGGFDDTRGIIAGGYSSHFGSAVNIIEIWDKELYEKAIDDAADDFAELAEEVMGQDDADGIS